MQCFFDRRLAPRTVAVAAALCFGAEAQAFTFQNDYFSGNFDSTLSVGLGLRTKSQDCGLILAGATGDNAPVGCLAPTSALGDQGDLNYNRGDLFAAQVKGSHELLLKFPDQWTASGACRCATSPQTRS
jgi:hypothetical protein